MAERIQWDLEIEGMTCDHCARTIDEVVRRIPGVIDSSTSHAARRAQIIADASVDAATLRGAIAGKGYEVVRHTAHPLERASGEDGDLDLVVVGGGSAGFAAAIRAADLGASVAIVEGGALGGTCVNVGCVPSKTLIRAAETFHRPRHHAFAGISAEPRPLDFRAVIQQKRDLVAELQQAKYWDVLAAYPSIQLLRGRARFRPDGVLEVEGQPVSARKVVLATGASPWAPPIPGLSDVPYLTSTTIMELDDLPERLIAIGGGAVGLELAQAFARFGSEVTVLEALPRIVPPEDADVGEALAGYLGEEGITVRTGVEISRVSGGPGAYRVEFEADGQRHVIEGDQLLVATGRRPNTADMGLEEAGIRLGEKGEVIVNGHLQTSREGVYAAGDVIGDPAFVYVAAHAGKVAAENALGGNAKTYDVTVVPRVTFTDPAVASVGLTEAQARREGLPIAVSKLPMAHVPRAIAARDTRGFIKLIAHAETNRLVGAHILAPEAGDIIEQAVMAMRFGIRVDEMAALLHPYLTNAEGLKLAAQAFEKDVAKLSCCAA